VRIPSTTVKPRFYVATSEKHAFSSWDALDEAIACIGRFKGNPDRKQIRGVIETGSSGRTWAHRVPHPVPFKDVPMLAVFTHKLPGRMSEWWKRVQYGSVRVNKDGTDHPDQGRYGIACTNNDALCHIKEQP